ncbi:MAG TPA: Ycf66 family protein [Crinalium sp.]|jgi:hypothetical protein
MLAYILAIAVGLGSFGLYMAAFFFPEVYRKYDFTWSGVGMFYALVLWVCAGRITGGVLLGQVASVALLGWFGWQTLTLRRELTPPDRKTQVSGSAKSLVEKVQNPLKRIQSQPAKRVETPSAQAEPQSAADTAKILISDGVPNGQIRDPEDKDTPETPESSPTVMPNQVDEALGVPERVSRSFKGILGVFGRRKPAAPRPVWTRPEKAIAPELSDLDEFDDFDGFEEADVPRDAVAAVEDEGSGEEAIAPAVVEMTITEIEVTVTEASDIEQPEDVTTVFEGDPGTSEETASVDELDEDDFGESSPM